MIRTLLTINWTNLRRDRVAQALSFLLPVLFFSIFALVFGNQGSNGTSRVRVAVVDDDHSEFSRRIVAGLGAEPALDVRTSPATPASGAPLDRAAAEALVRNGDVPVAIVLPPGFGAAAAVFEQSSTAPRITLLEDVSDQIAPQMVYGLLQKVVMTSAPDILMKNGLAAFAHYAGALTPAQQAAVNSWLPALRAASTTRPGQAQATDAVIGLRVDTVDVMRASNHESLISFYAAGIGVMFLLFAMSGASGTLLDEVDSGTLDRVLSTRVGMSGLLAGKWVYLTLLGATQLTVMFSWGWLVFHLDLFRHVGGFVIMTAFTAMAGAAFGLLLASLARTRAQLSGMSTIIILTMSALGGSMFPRFLMTATMQKVGLLTFNAWALDGFLKVFWRNAPIWQLWPQLVVLTGMTVAFLALARLFAKRWEAA